MTFPPYLAAIPCRLSASVFSGDCVFTVALANGEQYESASPRHFCWGGSGILIEDDTALPRESNVPGFIAVKVVDLPGSDIAIVEVPDGEVIAVSSQHVGARPTQIQPPRSIPA